MRLNLNGFSGNGPGPGEDIIGQRNQDAYNRSRLQMTVATSTFAGIALVGMFCSCLWFVCCRNSSSKTRKSRTWATAGDEMGHQNPYSYDGYLDSQGYMQMNYTSGGESGCESGVAPYVSNPLYHPNALYPSDNGIPNAYDFRDHVGFSQYDNTKMISLSSEGNMKDVPPSYTALFFAATDPQTRIGGNKGAGNESQSVNPTSDVRVTNIQPIHLKVTSSSGEKPKKEDNRDHQKTAEKNPENVRSKTDADAEYDYFMEDRNNDPSNAPPVSLLSVESDPGKEDDKGKSSVDNAVQKSDEAESRVPKSPPSYNPGYRGYQRF